MGSAFQPCTLFYKECEMKAVPKPVTNLCVCKQKHAIVTMQVQFDDLNNEIAAVDTTLNVFSHHLFCS